MGWQGYRQNFCPTGHFYTSQVGIGADHDDTCPDCGLESLISNVVDETNCDSVGIIPPSILSSLLVFPECNPQIYRVPCSDDEMAALEHYKDDRGKYVPCPAGAARRRR